MGSEKYSAEKLYRAMWPDERAEVRGLAKPKRDAVLKAFAESLRQTGDYDRLVEQQKKSD